MRSTPAAPASRPRRDHPGAGLDREGVVGGRGAGRAGHRARRPGRCARRLDGKPAAATTTRRKRAVFANALGYAVERRLLPANPLGQIQWKASDVAETVDRRSVANPPRPADS
jgi:hypothetical protein